MTCWWRYNGEIFRANTTKLTLLTINSEKRIFSIFNSTRRREILSFSGCWAPLVDGVRSSLRTCNTWYLEALEMHMVSLQRTKQNQFWSFQGRNIIREKICAGVRSQLPVINPRPPTLQLDCITIEKEWGFLVIGVEFVWYYSKKNIADRTSSTWSRKKQFIYFMLSIECRDGPQLEARTPANIAPPDCQIISDFKLHYLFTGSPVPANSTAIDGYPPQLVVS